ncbi:MAG: antibiotic biosynthesis monooxygenase [Alphaproteobacteria bacterium]|nr:antibiotic biosynthesis monooxygenase [Alphaproteobacteria bacterium]
MPKLALIAEFGVRPERREAFIALMKDHAKLSLETEPGCEQFDTLTQEGSETSVFLYELYHDQRALEAHMNSPHLASARGSYEDMITSKRVTSCELA